MGKLKDALEVFATRCAVTMYDLTLKLSKDGRVRGLWVFFEDDSEGRRKSSAQFYQSNFKHFTDALVNAGVLTKEQCDKNLLTIHLALTGHFPTNFQHGYESQGALMEWPEALKFYEAMGEEIEAARKRGDLPKVKADKSRAALST